MTTASWSTVVDHTSDAGFRAWGSELSGKFAAVGMVQTADTGQINWATVTRAAGSTVAGYEIWKTSDSSIFLKIEYGTESSTVVPGLWITAATGSNGSGTLTGQASTRTTFDLSSGVASTVTSYQSFLCATAAAVCLAWKLGSDGNVGNPRGLFVVGRTVDATGTPSSIGFYRLARQPTAGIVTLQSVRTLATAATFKDTTNFCVFVGQPSSSTDGTNNQVYLHLLNVPQVQPSLYSGTVIASELTVGSTMNNTFVGSTPHTYVAVSGSANISVDAGNTNPPILGLVMLWE